MITADRTKANNVALKKGTVKMTLNTCDGKSVNTELENAFIYLLIREIYFLYKRQRKRDNGFFAPTQQNL